MEGQHAPVHDIGAVALGGVFLGDICQTADHTLAGGRLLAGTAVAGLVGVDHRTDLDVLHIDIFRSGDRLDRGVDCLQGWILLRGIFALHAPALGLVDFLGPAHVLGVASGEGKLSQAQGVRPEGGGLTGRDQFIRRCDFVQDPGADLEQDVFRQRLQIRPGLDVGAVEQLDGGIGLAEALVDAGPVDRVVVIVGRDLSPAVKFRRRGQDAAVCGRRGDRARVHERRGCHLAVARLGALAVGEVPGGVADGEAVVHGRISRAEAGAAEGRLDDSASRHEVSDIALPGQVDEDRL